MTCVDQSISASAEDLEANRVRELAEGFRRSDADFARWAAGFGRIQHEPVTQLRVREMVDELVSLHRVPDAATAYRRMAAADRLTSAGMWLVAHMTYARRVCTDGTALEACDFKESPEGHTGGALNMVPAYVGYMLMNALDGETRSWMMGQGHCSAAIDAANVLVGNMTPEHSDRYDRSDAGLGRLVNDFYSYRLHPDGTPESPLGSHVNAHTAGGVLEGGYLGFAELQYVHAPLPGERLVAFLSDGAFEEQRGSDWAPRWWRAEDCGLVAPIMVLNGRRIEQRTHIAQQGGERWLERHLRLNGFEPIALDGRDPASIAWGIHVIESRLRAQGGGADSPVLLPYGIAETIKGFGFPGAGTNAAHNLPLPGIPARDQASLALFNEGAAALFVSETELTASLRELATHGAQNRPLERDHALATRSVPTPRIPTIEVLADGEPHSPMQALDAQFVAIIDANPGLRVRVGNPDELRSNRLDQTLDRLQHRVERPEPGVAESHTGSVITALNEEAVVSAALGNSGGLNLVVTYEAFAPKMLGAVRQHAMFARHLAAAGRPAGWLGIPLVLTSHTWENSKNEQSHQDPTFAEAWLSEMGDVARVVFPPDAASAAAALARVYRQPGQVTALVVPKRPVPRRLDMQQAVTLADDGVIVLAGTPATAQLLLIATGAYQLLELDRALRRLGACGIDAALVYLGEPGRCRAPRDAMEAAYVHADGTLAAWFPARTPRVFLTHTRPEPFLGALRRIDTGPATTAALGYINRGGTLDVPALLFANRATWAHVVDAATRVLSCSRDRVLSMAECASLDGVGDPYVVLGGEPHWRAHEVRQRSPGTPGRPIQAGHRVNMQRLLALNLGSTSLKAAVFQIDVGTFAASGTFQRARTAIHAGGDAGSQLDAVDEALASAADAPDIVVHRIVHGMDRPHGVELDDALLGELDALGALAPLHQPGALALARAARDRWPTARHGVAFDTSFHSQLSPWSRRLPIPEEYDASGIRRYGFHGLAFASALRQLQDDDPSATEGRVVLAHLGGGTSLCAVQAGRSIDTTMGLTPLGGVPMSTRSGDLDPGVMLHLLERGGLDVVTLRGRLEQESGLAGIAGYGDMRRLLEDPAPMAKLAVEQYVMRTAQAIAAMATALGGVDHLVFSGGGGNGSALLRARIAEPLTWLGVKLDAIRNKRGTRRIEAYDGIPVWNVSVDEEFELAQSAQAWIDDPPASVRP